MNGHMPTNPRNESKCVQSHLLRILMSFVSDVGVLIGNLVRSSLGQHRLDAGLGIMNVLLEESHGKNVFLCLALDTSVNQLVILFIHRSILDYLILSTNIQVL